MYPKSKSPAPAPGRGDRALSLPALGSKEWESEQLPGRPQPGRPPLRRDRWPLSPGVNFVPFKMILPQLRGEPRWSTAIKNLAGNTAFARLPTQIPPPRQSGLQHQRWRCRTRWPPRTVSRSIPSAESRKSSHLPMKDQRSFQGAAEQFAKSRMSEPRRPSSTNPLEPIARNRVIVTPSFGMSQTGGLQS